MTAHTHDIGLIGVYWYLFSIQLAYKSQSRSWDVTWHLTFLDIESHQRRSLLQRSTGTVISAVAETKGEESEEADLGCRLSPPDFGGPGVGVGGRRWNAMVFHVALADLGCRLSSPGFGGPGVGVGSRRWNAMVCHAVALPRGFATGLHPPPPRPGAPQTRNVA